MWVKICGNTNEEDARCAVEAGADALGFVFAPSPRRVGAEQVRGILSRLREGVESYGVFVDAGVEEIVRTVVEAGLSGVQLHRTPGVEGYDPRLAGKVREALAAAGRAGTKIIAVLAGDAGLAEQMEMVSRDVDAVLVDARSAHAAGGTGQRFDWGAAQDAFRGAGEDVRLIVAGGLDAGNVEEALRVLKPWGVDVVTGAEASPGRKDARKVAAFVQAARRGAGRMAGLAREVPCA